MSEWAATIVPVIKSDGSIRINGDYKITINHVAKPDNYYSKLLSIYIVRSSQNKDLKCNRMFKLPVSLYVNMYIYAHVCTYIHTYIFVYVCMHGKFTKHHNITQIYKTPALI